jgi:hypothetical protein
VAQIVDKFNTFLGMASRVDFEAIFCEYEAVAVRLNVLDQQYLNAVKQKSEVDSALAASLRLLSQGGNMPSNLEVTHRRLQAEQQEMQSRVLLLREKITAARSELSRLVQKAKDLQAIHRYHSQGAV